jgi:hypothetical protein
MARIGQPSNRPPKVPVLIAVAAAGAIGTTMVLQQLPTEEPAPGAAAMVDTGAIFGNSFEGNAGGGAPVPPKACPAPPAGFSEVSRTWTQIFAYGYPCGRMQYCERNLRQYPQGQSYPAPVGAEKGTYVVVPFVATPAYVNWFFDQVQSRSSIGYTQRPAEGMLFTLSRCRGDVLGEAMGAWCSIYGNGGSLQWTTGTGGSNLCRVQVGESLFLHVMAVDPTDGITPGEHSCENVAASSSGCDVGVRPSVGPAL